MSFDALDLFEWSMRHQEALFIAFLVLMGVRLVAAVIVAIDHGVQHYREGRIRKARYDLTKP